MGLLYTLFFLCLLKCFFVRFDVLVTMSHFHAKEYAIGLLTSLLCLIFSFCSFMYCMRFARSSSLIFSY